MKTDNLNKYDIYSCLNKEKIAELCNGIDMPEEVTHTVCKLIDSYDFSRIAPYYHKLFLIQTCDVAVKEIDTVLENEKDKGYIWLTTYLACAIEAKNVYDELGINEQIYYDTMAAFSRFVCEHKESFGVYGFDRQWWNYRQTSCTLFRIGELEYEMLVYSGTEGIINGQTVIKKNDNVISIHIPSNAKITPQNVEASLKMAIDFFNKYFVSFKYDVLYCESWIISPNLKYVLNENSNIVKFLERFEIYEFIPESDASIRWVFKNVNLSIDEFPQDTSLQRNIVKYIKQGGKIGLASGIIRKIKL